ncbi:MAG: hypothetical protein FJW39_01400 [Acidobacteria bacterium]|nr:hypothetical protein [Acidobacteriota bacterium]
MSKSPRPSLTQLGRVELPERSAPSIPAELETAVLGGGGTAPAPEADIQPAVKPAPQPPTQPHTKPDAQQAVQQYSPGTRLIAKSGPKRPQPTQSVTYRLPVDLYNQLSDVAHDYRLNMTDIVVEALERHLVHFPLRRR